MASKLWICLAICLMAKQACCIVYETKLFIYNGVAKEIGKMCDEADATVVPELASGVNPVNMTMLLYTQPLYEVHNMANAVQSILQSSNFNRNKNVTVFVMGHNGKPDGPIVTKIGRKYVEKGLHNFLSFDISDYITGDYITVAGLVPYISTILSDFLAGLVSNGISANRIHLIGLSLGAQVTGYTGRKFNQKTNMLLQRITVIDPAGFCFVDKPGRYVNKGDAAYVDAIKTSIQSIKDDLIGHADFFVNGNWGIQPNCGLTTDCNHIRGGLLYAESVLNEKGFFGKKCDGLQISDFTCHDANGSYMGYASSPDSRGAYLVYTNAAEPYAKN